MSDYLPGPYKVLNELGGTGGRNLIEPNYNAIELSNGQLITGCENRDTMTLLAGAPDLLEACELIRNDSVAFMEGSMPYKSQYDMFKQFIKWADKAIQKAKGKGAE